MRQATLKETICLIEAKERAARLVAGNSAASGHQDAATEVATSSYRKILCTDKCLNQTAKCEECGESFKKHGVRSVCGKDDKLLTYKVCKDCHVKVKRKQQGKKSK